MTLDDSVVILFENLGEPTDFNPYASDWTTLDPASQGYIRLTGLLNAGQTACANYKKRRGGALKFPVLTGTHNVKIKTLVVTFDIDALDDTKIYFRKSDLPNPTVLETETYGRFTNAKILIEDITYDVDTSVFDALNDRWEIYLTESLPPITGDKIATVKKNTFMMVERNHPWVYENFIKPDILSAGYGRGNIVYVLSMNDITNVNALVKMSSFEQFLFAGDSFDAPTEYNYIGKEIRFDSFPEDGNRFSISYYRTPTELTKGTDEFELPEQFHYGIILWATFRGFGRIHEVEMSQLTRREWNEFMNLTKSENDYRLMHSKGGSFKLQKE